MTPLIFHFLQAAYLSDVMCDSGILLTPPSVTFSGCTSPCTPKLAEDNLQDSDGVITAAKDLCVEKRSNNLYLGFGVNFSGVVKPVSMCHVSLFMQVESSLSNRRNI